MNITKYAMLKKLLGGGAGSGGATVNFYNGETLLETQEINHPEDLVRPANPTIESTAQYDYKFLGWSLDGKTVLTSFIAPVAASKVNYYAVFEQIAKLETLNNIANWYLSELDPYRLEEFY